MKIITKIEKAIEKFGKIYKKNPTVMVLVKMSSDVSYFAFWLLHFGLVAMAKLLAQRHKGIFSDSNKLWKKIKYN